MERFGLIGDSFDKMVEKELRSPLAQLYFGLHPSSLDDKRSFLDEMDKYVQFARLNGTKTQAFDELETTLELDIFRIINKKPYTEGDTLVFSKQALEEYKSLPDTKRALFRESLLSIPHKKKNFTLQKQKTRV